MNRCSVLLFMTCMMGIAGGFGDIPNVPINSHVQDQIYRRWHTDALGGIMVAVANQVYHRQGGEEKKRVAHCFNQAGSITAYAECMKNLKAGPKRQNQNAGPQMNQNAGSQRNQNAGPNGNNQNAGPRRNQNAGPQMNQNAGSNRHPAIDTPPTSTPHVAKGHVCKMRVLGPFKIRSCSKDTTIKAPQSYSQRVLQTTAERRLQFPFDIAQHRRGTGPFVQRRERRWTNKVTRLKPINEYSINRGNNFQSEETLLWWLRSFVRKLQGRKPIDEVENRRRLQPESYFLPDTLEKQKLADEPGLDLLQRHGNFWQKPMEYAKKRQIPALELAIARAVPPQHYERQHKLRYWLEAFAKDLAHFGGSDNITARVLSPTFLSFSDGKFGGPTPNEVKVLSPSLFSLDNDTNSIIPLPELLKNLPHEEQQYWNQTIVQFADTLTQAKQFATQLAAQRASLQDTHLYTKRDFVELNGGSSYAFDLFENLYKDMTETQWKEVATKGYGFMTNDQIERFYGRLYAPEREIRSMQYLAQERDREAVLFDALANLTAEVEDFHVRHHDIVGTPLIRANLKGAGETLSQKIIRSPLVFSPIIMSPSVRGPLILSPMLFSPLVLSPRALGPLVLSPGVGNPFILSPMALNPLILSPQVMSPLVLSPIALSPLILSPGVMMPLILSPFVLSPLILSPQVLFALVLSPFALSPLVLSPLAVAAVVLSPSVLSPVVG